jgi:AbrB family looped-hinge helix DNA binding protein
MSKCKTVKMNNKGMITIPTDLRKKFQFKEGSEFVLLEIEGRINLIPILDLDQISCTDGEKLSKSIDTAHEEEIELEE